MFRGKRSLPCLVALAMFAVSAIVRAFPYEDGILGVFATGASPAGLATGDFNEDGFDDVVSANTGSDDLTVFFGSGDDFLNAGASGWAAGDGPAFVGVGDFDGDLNLDLAVALANDDAVAILLGDGTANFSAPDPYPVGNVGFSGSIVIEDFDGDGNADIAVNDMFSDQFSILMGNGDGTFDPSVEYATDQFPSGIVAGFFDADANLDLVTANVFGSVGTDGNLSFFSGNGDGTFDAAAHFADEVFHPEGLATTDLDGDLELDLVVGGEGIVPPGRLYVLLGNGDGTFGAAAEYDGIGVTGVILDDLDGDGNTDVLTNESGYGVYLGNGDGTVQPGYFFGAGGGGHFTSGDYNEDGETDLISTARDRDFLRAAVGNGDGTFEAPRYYPQTSVTEAIALGDFDEDGVADMAVPGRFDDAVSVRLANGDGTYGDAADYGTASEPIDLFVGDFNTDGNLDLSVPNYGSTASDTISVLLGNGDGTFAASVEFGEAVPFLFPVAIDGGDFDGDDDIDLVVSHDLLGGGVTYFENDGSGAFSPVPLSSSGFPKDVLVAELNGDDVLDFALAHEIDATDNISLYFGNGDGTFAAPSFAGADATDADSPRAIAGGDFDGDGDADLAVADETHALSAVYLNDGAGAFVQAAEYVDPSETADVPYEIAAADLDLDCDVDFVTSLYGGNHGFALFLGNGDGSFVPTGVDGPTELMTAVTVGDVDAAGNPDLLLFSDDWGAVFTYVSSGVPGSCGGGGGGGGGGGAVAPAPAVRVLFPNGGESLVAGTTRLVEWTTAGRVDFVNLDYSFDQGATWRPIARGAVNGGQFSWSVPDVEAPSVLLRIEATDLATVFASDQSDAPFAIRDGQPVLVETVVDGLRALVNLTTGCRSFPEGVFLPNPVTMQPESIGEICPGDYITAPSFKTIYYVTTEFIRRPFYDVLTFLTHQPSFQGVKIVTDATLLTLRLDGLMLPKPGSVLVAFQGSPDVYALFENPRDALKPIARPLANEAAAEANFGPGWSASILEFPPTLFGLFEYGSPIEGREEIDASRLLRRADLERVVNPYTFALIRKMVELLHENAR